jgi:ABC-type multidrug transport system fused ATPase/permease subunit
MLFLPRIKEIQYVNYSLNGSFINTLIFSLLISLLPIFLLAIWKKAPIESVKQRLKSIFIFTVLILSFIVVTHFLYKFYLMSLVEKLNGIATTLDINSTIFNKVLFLAEIFSSIIIYFSFKKK